MLGLRHMLEESLNIDNARLMSDVAFERAARAEIAALTAARHQLRSQNLMHRGLMGDTREAGVAQPWSSAPTSDARAAPSQAPQHAMAITTAQATSESELTTAVTNLNRVYDSLVRRKGGNGHDEQTLAQWDTLSGIMEDADVRKHVAMDGLELADVYKVVDQLHSGNLEGSAKDKGGKGDGAQASAAPPCDRSKFERFFLVRHLGLLEAYLKENKEKKDTGGAHVGNLLSQVTIQQTRAWTGNGFAEQQQITRQEMRVLPNETSPEAGGAGDDGGEAHFASGDPRQPLPDAAAPWGAPPPFHPGAYAAPNGYAGGYYGVPPGPYGAPPGSYAPHGWRPGAAY
jgi:hypothetical protein